MMAEHMAFCNYPSLWKIMPNEENRDRNTKSVLDKPKTQLNPDINNMKMKIR